MLIRYLSGILIGFTCSLLLLMHFKKFVPNMTTLYLMENAYYQGCLQASNWKQKRCYKATEYYSRELERIVVRDFYGEK